MTTKYTDWPSIPQPNQEGIAVERAINEAVGANVTLKGLPRDAILYGALAELLAGGIGGGGGGTNLGYIVTTMAVGNTGLQNRASLQSDVTNATSQNKALYIPPGAYTVTLDAVNNQITYTGNLTVIGAGRGLTQITVGPDPLTFDGGLFTAVADNTSIYLRDFTIIGPTTYTGFSDTAHSTLVVDVTNSAWTATVDINAVDITGRWLTAVQSSCLHGNVTIRNAIWSGMIFACVGVFDSTKTVPCARAVYLENCVFTSGRPPAEASDGITGHGNTVYIHPHISVKFTNVEFGQNYRVQFAHYSTSAAGESCQFAHLNNVWFHDGVIAAIISSGDSSHSYFNDVAIDQGGLVAHGALTWVGGSMGQPNSAKQVYIGSSAVYTPATTPELNLVGLRVYSAQGTALSGDAIHNIRWLSSHFFCYDRGANTQATIVSGNYSKYTRVQACQFTSYGSASAANAAAFAIQIAGTTANANTEVIDCVFTGNWGSAPIGITMFATTNALIRGCDLSAATGQVTGTPAIIFTTGTSQRAQIIRTKLGGQNVNGTDLFQLAVLPDGESPNTVASASSITINDTDYDRIPVSGTTTINTITLGKLRNQPGTKLQLRLTGAAAIGTSGNILPAHTAARVAGDIVSFVYDAGASKWREIGTAVGVSQIAATGYVGAGAKVLFDDGSWAVPPGAGGGEANTLALQAAAVGVSLVGTKTGTALGVKGVAGNSTRITTTSNATDVLIDAAIGTTAGTLAGGDVAIDLAQHKIASQAAGDTFIAASASALKRLPKGTNGQWLIQGATDPAWTTPTSAILPTVLEVNGGTAQSAYARGDILRATAVNTLGRLALGASGMVLSSDGTDAAWQALVAAQVPTLPLSKTVGVPVSTIVAATYTLTQTDDQKRFDSSAADQTITLPAASANIGRLYRLKSVSSPPTTHITTFVPAGADKIENLLLWELRANNEYVDLMGNTAGAGWDVHATSFSDAPYALTPAGAVAVTYMPFRRTQQITLNTNTVLTIGGMHKGDTLVLLVDTGAGGFSLNLAAGSGMGGVKYDGGSWVGVTQTGSKRDKFIVEFDGSFLWVTVGFQSAA